MLDRFEWKTDTTLISRGSELFRRYIREDAVPPSIMGYSLTGIVDAVGSEGDRLSGWGARHGRSTARAICCR